jgi:predicted CXXCH cytochrome family protein
MKVLALAFIMVFLLTGYVFSAEVVPEIKKDCSICHVSNKTATEIHLRRPLSDLCLECHPDRGSPADHIVDVTPSMEVKDLPLDKDGKMTCVTCHDPHGMTGLVKLLRDSPSDICGHCHRM